jgi:hypothetical protein
MSAVRPITIGCTAALARALGARNLPSVSAISVPVVFVVQTEVGLMFWPVKHGALSNSVGHPANRKRGGIV